MKNLQLSLKTKWFRMTQAGIKTEDYRETTPYWYSRLCLYDGQEKSQRWWKQYFDIYYSIDEISRTSFKSFDQNIMTLGYPKSTDLSRILKLEHKGIEIREGNPEWGAEVGKLYFVIKHGQIIKN